MTRLPQNARPHESPAARLTKAVNAATPAILETLERRQLLSATLVNGQLVINTANDEADVVSLTLAPSGVPSLASIVVDENGTTTSFPVRSVSGIQIDTAGGNDKITLSNDSLSISILAVKFTFQLPRAVIAGGAGNDTIQGGPGADVIYGDNRPLVAQPGTKAFALPIFDDGAGNDSINGGKGNDTVSGGGGSDRIAGDAGNDLIHGNGGNDVLEPDGGAGNDSVFGDAGEDSISGGSAADGSDFLSGGDNGNELTDVLDLHNRSGNLSVLIGQPGASGEAGEGDTIAADFELIYGGNGADHFVGTDGVDVFNSGGGDDLVEGLGGDDSLFGFFGNDTILGGDGNDYLDGQDDSNLLDAGPGNDTLTAGFGRDTFVGGDGSDTVSYDFYTENLELSPDGVGHSGRSGESDQINTDIEGLIGGRGNDKIVGGVNAETLIGLGGNDTILGGDGDDRIRGDDGDDELRGGNGRDTIDGGLGRDVLNPNGQLSRSPVLRGGDVLDYSQRTENLTISLNEKPISGADGEGDTIVPGFIVILGGSGNDTITGADRSEKIFANAGNDVIDARGGNDRIDGGDGDDAIRGGRGNDTMRGENGNDRLDGGLGTDIFIGGAGTDTLNYSNRTQDLKIFPDNKAHSGAAGENDLVRNDFEIIRTGSGNDVIFGTANADTIFAGAGNDVVRGLAGNDRIDGGDGNDQLIGGDGNDVLIGRAGLDSLYGQNGTDLLYADDGFKDFLNGGKGRDRFRSDAIDRLVDLETRA